MRHPHCPLCLAEMLPYRMLLCPRHEQQSIALPLLAGPLFQKVGVLINHTWHLVVSFFDLVVLGFTRIYCFS